MIQVNTALLTATNIGKKFNYNKVLNDISFDIFSGNITALIGDNGAGKSTLIKILSGYHSPDAGELYWQGRKINFSNKQGPAYARKLGIQVVYQNLALIENMPIWRNFFLGNELISPFSLRQLDIKRMREITQCEINKLGFDLHADKDVSQLSGGEKQVIAIGRASYFHSKLLILDEPTSALSYSQSEKVLTCIKGLAKQQVAIILVTHTLDTICDIADHVLVLYQGSLVANKESKNISKKMLIDMINEREVNV